MRMWDAIVLAWKNVRVFSKQSLKIILVMGMVFGVIFWLQFWFQGIKNTYENFANYPTDGRVIMTISTDTESMGIKTEQKMSAEEMLQDVEKYGRVVGEAETYGLLYNGLVLDEELVKDLVEINLDEVPAGMVPIVVSTFLGEQMFGYSYNDRAIRTPEQKMSAYEEYRAKVVGKSFVYGDVEYFVVGLAPGGFHATSLAVANVSKDKLSLMDAILEQITIGVGGKDIIVRNGGGWEQFTEVVGDEYVVVFENAEKAYDFFEEGKGMFVDMESRGGYAVDVVAGMSPKVKWELGMLQMIINVICIILAAIAVIIVIFTSIGLIDEDRENVCLYYDIGATQKQVRVVYGWYFLWLMLGVLVISVLVAVIGIVVYSWANQAALQALYMTTFNLINVPRIVLLGVNCEVVICVASIIMMAFVCVGVNHKGLKYSVK